jgi:hypothetical protein
MPRSAFCGSIQPRLVEAAAVSAMLKCKRDAVLARKRRSPGTSSKCRTPPPSMSKETLGPIDATAVLRVSSARNAPIRSRRSTRSRASKPIRGDVKIGGPPSAPSPSAAAVPAKAGAETGESPRICRLPRCVTSTMPLPCAWLASQRATKASRGIGADGVNRTSSPSPVGIGCEMPGHAPRRSAFTAILRENC